MSKQKVNEILSFATHTDYVNRYPLLLQTTLYNFTGTHTTGEICVGIVNASGVTGVHPKNPAQHAADIAFLEKQSELLSSVFTNPVTNSKKIIECIRVDGGSDEGPIHEEVQYFGQFIILQH